MQKKLIKDIARAGSVLSRKGLISPRIYESLFFPLFVCFLFVIAFIIYSLGLSPTFVEVIHYCTRFPYFFLFL